MTSIPEGLFASCMSLRAIDIPIGVISIGDRAFSCCKSLKGIVIPWTVENIGEKCFLDCENLETMALSVDKAPQFKILHDMIQKLKSWIATSQSLPN